jgi:beta-lactamase regulating signal transducer with metallopeptidase domain
MIGQMVMYLGERTLWFGDGALAKGVLLLLVTALLVRLFARSSASLRHLIWGLGLAGVLAVSLGAWLLPAWNLPGPAAPEIASVGEGARTVFIYDAAGDAYGRSLPSPSRPSAILVVMALWPTLLFAAWALGAAFLLLRVALDLLAARRLAGRARAIEGPRLLQLVRNLAAELGLRRLPELRQSAEIDCPATTGILRPVVLLPVHTRDWKDQELRAVLAHELAHADRGDCGSQLLARVVCALHWPNPLVWWAARRLLAEREMAADDMALRAGSSASDYAGLLLHLVSAATARPAPALRGALSMAGGSPLGERVARLLDPVRSRAGVPRRLIAMAATGLVAVALTFGCFGGSESVGEEAAESVAPAQAASNGSPKKLWLAVAKTESKLGRDRELIEALDGPSPRLSGIEIHKMTWRTGVSGVLLHETYLAGPRANLEAFVASVVSARYQPERVGLASDAAARERVLLENLPDGRARTHVYDLSTRIDLDRPELEVITDELGRPEIAMQFRPADARRINQVTGANLGKRLLVVAGDDRVLAAPTVQSALSDRGRISFGGDTSEAEARELAAAIGATGIERIVFPRQVILSAAEGAGQLVDEPRIHSRIPLTPGESRWIGMTICVDESGAVTDVKILGGTALEDTHQITTAVKSWRFRPYLKDGKPAPFCYPMRVQGHPVP